MPNYTDPNIDGINIKKIHIDEVEAEIKKIINQEGLNISSLQKTSLSDHSVWVKIYSHRNKGGTVLYSSYVDALNNNTEDKFSKLYLLDNFYNNDHKLELMLKYPSLSSSLYNRWIQNTNPFRQDRITNGVVPGYTKVHCDWDILGWGGLCRANPNYTAFNWTLITGSTKNTDSYFSIGPYKAWQGGIPGPSSSAGYTGTTELWVRIDNTYYGKDATLIQPTTFTKVNSINIMHIQDAIHKLEAKFANNCCESNKCQTCQTKKCESCQDSCICQSDKCESCQDACTCQSCQTNGCQKCQNACTCQSCQKNCDCNCDCCGDSDCGA